ncbi:MAG: ABC transporter ATP-binding protein [Caldimonas sp.]
MRVDAPLLQETLPTSGSGPGDSSAGAPLLEAEALVLHAGGEPRGRVLFDGLSLRVAPGERWVVVGPNGAGKSSLLAALAGVFPIAAGSVRIDGVDLASWTPSALAGRRAWSPQFWSDPFPSTVRETAALARQRDAGWRALLDDCDDAEVDRILGVLLLADLAEADVQSLSGGERQRVAIATAVLQGAPLLLLDEPASHLDLAHQRLLVDVLLAHAAGGGAVVASLHDLNLAWDLASHVVLLDGAGRALAGRRDEVLVAERLGAVFGVAIHALAIDGAARFVVGARGPPPAPPEVQR